MKSVSGMNIPTFTLDIIGRLKSAGYQAYIVGGAVRDMVLKRPAGDWDVATSAPPEQIEILFSNIRHFPQKHGTVTLVDAGRHYEVTAFRGHEKEGEDIEADLGHRDFTMNAMAYDTDFKIILDPYGGKKDIGRNLIRAVGKPEDRFREDPARLLRAVRLAAELGFKIQKKTANTMALEADRLRFVAPERIRDELVKILMIGKPSQPFQIMRRSGLLARFLPELLEGYGKRQDTRHRYTVYRHIVETMDRVRPDPVLRLAALLHDIAKPRVREKKQGEWRFGGHAEASCSLATGILGRLRFSKKMIMQVTNLIRHHSIHYQKSWSDGSLRRMISVVGAGNVENLLSLRRADLISRGIATIELELLNDLGRRLKSIMSGTMFLKTCDLAVDGRQVMNILGLSPGPRVGSVLRDLKELVIEQPEFNSEEQLKAFLKDQK